MVIIILIVLLVFIIVFLMIYNLSLHKKLETYSNVNQKIDNIKILQSFMDTVGEYSSVETKLNRINKIILERFEMLKYSTIVVFDGAEYQIKASNVDEQHWESLKELGSQEIFADSIATATPKYVTVDKESERLPYQKMEFGRAKSAMFFPIYIDNVYIGYWLIESSQIHAFDHIDTAIIEVIRDNIVTVLKTVEYQKTIENIVRTDEFSGLKSAEYLYAEGKKIVDEYTISTVCMFSIINIKKVNEEFGREIGNSMITKVSGLVKSSISKEYLFVRYMGPKFIIVFPGIIPDDTSDFLTTLKNDLEALEIGYDDDEAGEYDTAKPIINFVATSYYKGTSMDGAAKKLEEYIDSTDPAESDINYI